MVSCATWLIAGTGVSCRTLTGSTGSPTSRLTAALTSTPATSTRRHTTRSDTQRQVGTHPAAKITARSPNG